MASAVAGMLSELLQTQQALRYREAELAAGVPVATHPEERRRFSERLEAVLKSAAEAVGSRAAALYLLDDATTCLKLRSSWGLPPARFVEQARPLQDALADLEAMLGHAVVLEDTAVLASWNTPEDCRAAACVPVSTATTILGTLWVFDDNPRDFTESQTGILEIAAGRIAVELEREMLLREGVEGAGLKRQLAAAERVQRNQLPTIAPLLQGWDIAGWADQAQEIGGDFYDWFCLPDGLLAVAVGSAADLGVPAALVAGNVKTALRAHAQYHRELGRLLRQVNLTIWTGSAGDQTASLFCGLVDTATGRICVASAGQPSAILLQPDGWQSLVRPSVFLGESPEADFGVHRIRLRPGEALLLFTSGCRRVGGQPGHPLNEVALADLLAGSLHLSAKELTALARERLDNSIQWGARQDRAILVIKRTDS